MAEPLGSPDYSALLPASLDELLALSRTGRLLTIRLFRLTPDGLALIASVEGVDADVDPEGPPELVGAMQRALAFADQTRALAAELAILESALEAGPVPVFTPAEQAAGTRVLAWLEANRRALARIRTLMGDN